MYPVKNPPWQRHFSAFSTLNYGKKLPTDPPDIQKTVEREDGLGWQQKRDPKLFPKPPADSHGGGTVRDPRR